MQNNKYKNLVILLIVVLQICMLCACIPDKVSEELIELPTYRGADRIYVGTYRITDNKKMGSDKIVYEVEHGKQEGLLNLFRDSKYFVDEIELSSYLHLNNNGNNLKLGHDALWCAKNGTVWVCQPGGEKRVIVQKVDYANFESEDRSLNVWISYALLMVETSKCELNVEYTTPHNWEGLKKFYSSERISDEEKVITIDCLYYYEDEPEEKLGTTKLYFNEANNTIKVSSDFLPN